MRKMIVIVLSLFLFFESNAQTIIQLEVKDGMYYLPCKVNGFTLNFLFDTGASGVGISQTEASMMLDNNYLLESDFKGTTSGMLASGDVLESRNLNLREIEIGGRKIYNIEGSIICLDCTPLLGQSVLRQLGSYKFDYSNNTLTLLDEENNVVTNNSIYGCVSGNCYNGQGTYTFPEGDKYVGEFRDGIPNGKGIFTYYDGVLYDGEFKDGKPDGKGTLTYPDGEKYIGEFREDNYNGYGTYTYPDGEKYVGEFKDGKYNGQGTYTSSDGEKYVGEFRDGNRNGQGTLTYPDGKKYVGEFKDDKYNGYGTYTFPEGDKYVGEFRDGKYNGQGTYTSSGGNKYVGEFKDGKYIGK
jgi:hypothetical protein